MSYKPTPLTPSCVSFSALADLVSNFIASVAHALVTLKWLMSVLPAGVAVNFLALVSAVAGEVPKIAAIVAF